MQQGCDDCAIFAIAFASSLARGEQTGGFFDEQNTGRKHLVEAVRSNTKDKTPSIQSEALSRYTSTLYLQVAKFGRN